jgi:hypothetical protein
MGQLTRVQAIAEIEFPRSRAVTSLYGLNIPLVLDFLDVFWRNSIVDLDLNEQNEDGFARSLWSRRTQNILRCLVEFFDPCKDFFSFLVTQNSPIKDFEAFILSLKQRLPEGYRVRRCEDTWQIVEDLKKASRIRVRDLRPKKWQNGSEANG